MGFTIITTEIFLTGKKETVLRILKRADISVDGEKLISHGGEVTLLDFLDEENRRECFFYEQVASYDRTKDIANEENYGIVLSHFIDKGSNCIVKLCQTVSDDQYSYDRDDWINWCNRMVILYGCRILMNEESFTFGRSKRGESSFDDEDHFTYVFRPEDERLILETITIFLLQLRKKYVFPLPVSWKSLFRTMKESYLYCNDNWKSTGKNLTILRMTPSIPK